MNVLNGAATLREAVQSVLAQSFADWELIVWDDCSTDDSASIVAGFGDARICYCLASKPMSLGEARDAAIRAAQGEWLAFLDQDDVWLPQKLEQQMMTHTGQPRVAMVYGRTVAFFPDGSQHDQDYFHEFGPLPEGNIFEELAGRGCFVVMSSAILRRSAVMSVMPIPKEVQVTPDYYLYLRVCSQHEVRAVQDVVSLYRMHTGSMTEVYRRESLEESLWLVERCRSQLDPRLYQRRRAHIATAIAFDEMRYGKSFADGLRRLVNEGSPLWLAGRPFVRLWRKLRRRLQRPYWRKSGHGSLVGHFLR